MSYIIKKIKNKIKETKTPLINRSFVFNSKERILDILQRISEKEPTINPTLIQLKEKKRQSYILNLKNFNESDLNEIKEDMNNREKNLLLQINEFKKGTIEFEQDKKKIFNNFQNIKKENRYFSLLYKQFKKRTVKKGENELMKNDNFFKIANTYLLKNIRLPDLSRNIFNSNPLILDNEHIKPYFIYNKNVDSQKFLNYLDRIKDILGRKILGSYSLSQDERRHLEELKRKEKPKGYIPPEVLIPSLQEDITKTQFTYDCLINEYNNKNNISNNININKNSVDSNISSYMNNNTSVNNMNNKSTKSIFNSKNKKYDLKKLIIKKINFVKNSKKNNKLIKDSFSNNNYNNSSLDTTSVPHDTKKNNISDINININNKTNLVNSNSMINIRSPLKERLKSNTQRVIQFFNKDLDESNLIKKNLLKKSFNSNINKEKEKNNLSNLSNLSTSTIQGNKLELFTPQKKVDFFKLINFNEKEKENFREKNRHSSLKNLNVFFPQYQSPNYISEDLNNLNNNSKNDESKQNTRKINLNLSSRYDSFQKKLSMPKIKEKSDNEKNQEINIENLYNKALNLNNKSYEDEVDLENYLLSMRGKNKNLNEIMSLKNTYFNIKKMENNFYKNIIKEEYNFRIKNRIQGRFLNDKQNKILNKSDKFNSIFLRNANLFRKVICERDKDTFD